jgi:hypothetical protein
MPDCPNLAKCPFFNDKLANKPATAEMMKKSFCKGDHVACARWIVCQKLGGPQVPGDLFPSMADRAKAIIAGRPG